MGGGYRTSDGHRDDADGTLRDLYGRVGYQLRENWDISLFSLLTDNEASDPRAEGAPEAEKEGNYETRAFLTTLSPYVGINQLLGKRSGMYLMPSAGTRYTGHSEFDGKWAPHAGLVLGYKEIRMYANYSRGVVYPGLDVIVFSETVILPLGQSWKDLDPEICPMPRTSV